LKSIFSVSKFLKKLLSIDNTLLVSQLKQVSSLRIISLILASSINLHSASSRPGFKHNPIFPSSVHSLSELHAIKLTGASTFSKGAEFPEKKKYQEIRPNIMIIAR
jgi:hypothetical protein